MTLGGWALANPAGLAWCLLALPIIGLHVLRPRRVQAQVAAVYLWRQVATPVSAARPWQRLVPSWLLAAQLLAALLLGLIMAQPVRLTEQALAEHSVFVIDASASMQATDGAPDRLGLALDRAAELRRQVPAGGEASLIVAGPRARALLTRSSDIGAFDDALATVGAGDGEADFTGAFALAAGLDTPEVESGVVFVSDGGVDEADLRTAPVGTRYERVGTTATNRGITQLSVEPGDGGLVARVSVAHFGGPASTQELRIDVDGITVDNREVSLDPGEVVNVAVPVPGGEKIEAFLASDDALGLDDRAVATVARRPTIQVLWAGPDNPFLAAALEAVPGLEITRADAVPTPAESEAGAGIDPAIDLVVADRVAVPDDLSLPLLAVAPPGGAGDIGTAGVVTSPILTLIRDDVPLVAELDLLDVHVAESQRVTVPVGADVVLGAEGAPLLVITEEPVPTVYLSFALDQSTLPLQAAFPLLIDRAVSNLTDSLTPPPRITVGSELPIDSRSEATITAPDGTAETIPPGSSRPTADRVGFWAIEQVDRDPVLVAVAPTRAESSVAPAADVPFQTPFEGTAGAGQRGEIPFLGPIIAVVLVLLVIEYLLARRRRGVGPRQWTVAGGLRAAVALALVVALVSPSISRPANDPATVFLIDASDSMTAGARAEAVAVVRDALGASPDGARSAIVVFGQDARLEALLAAEVAFDGVSVEVDGGGTDLSAALRLGAAALPTDARRRLVLVSDGRATSGDARGEARRLADDGVPLDVVVIEPASGLDLAVAAVDVPTRVSVGEQVEIAVQVVAPRSGEAEIVLSRGGDEIERRTEQLTAGDNTVVFTDVVAGDGLLRYQVEVNGSGDRVDANDVGYAAVPVVGAETVLVIDGSDGAGDGLAVALSAGGLVVERATPGSFPAIDELSGYASIVLVDVDRRDLSDAQVADLSGAVRDLGRGLVVVGGTQTYALGGYRDSDLEQILPVVSEITDPLRRQSVAEVLAIDTSGSMGACHCDEDGRNGLGGGNRIGGGVSKTAIASNAVTRAIAALEATDEVGLLSMDADDTWLIDLQPTPPQDVVDAGVQGLVPDGPTFVDSGLLTAAESLRESDASLKHIIFFSDGFTEFGALETLEEQAADLLAEGITVSVVATGEGAADELEPIATAGGGRFYPGRNLEQIPELIVSEAVMASRDFVNEGEFLPLVSSSREPVRSLTASPSLAGYIATSAKPTASVDLRIGPDEDPLLASWQVGLGRASAWTSDGGERWAASWAAWDGNPDFWAAVVKDTFPIAGDGAVVEASISDGRLDVRVDATDDWSDDATSTIRLAGPDGSTTEVNLERLDGSTFAGSTDVADAGTYALGAVVADGGETVWGGVGLASRPYPAEYAPRPVAADELTRLAGITAGRVDPGPLELFDPAGTVAGTSRFPLAPWLLLFAVIAWPVAVASSRLVWRRGVLAQGTKRASATIGELRARLPKMAEPDLGAHSVGTGTSEIGPKGATGTKTHDKQVVSPVEVTPSGPESSVLSSTVTSRGDRSGTDRGSSVGKADDGGDDDDSSTLSALLARKRSRE